MQGEKTPNYSDFGLAEDGDDDTRDFDSDYDNDDNDDDDDYGEEPNLGRSIGIELRGYYGLISLFVVKKLNSATCSVHALSCTGHEYSNDMTTDINFIAKLRCEGIFLEFENEA